MNGVLAIDAGQTGIRAQAADAEVFEVPGIRTDLPLEPQLAAVVAEAVTRGLRFDSVAIGTSGFTRSTTAAAELLALATQYGVRRTAIAHDSVTSYLGALGDTPGAIVAAGTGVVTFAVGESRVARVDGWGYIMGDAGSGWWIGRAALEAVMRAYDGRGPATALTAVVEAEFPSLEDAYIQLQSDEGRVRRVAAFSKSVGDLAASDPVAQTICEAAGAELAVSVLAALERVDQHVEPYPVVCVLGNVMRSAAVSTAFQEMVRVVLPGVVLREPLGTGLDGAGLLFDLAPDSALHDLVVVAPG